MDPATVGTASPEGTEGRRKRGKLLIQPVATANEEKCTEGRADITGKVSIHIKTGIAQLKRARSIHPIEEERKMPQGFMQHAHIFTFASDFSKDRNSDLKLEGHSSGLRRF
ncbi:hypothetical protein CEXT_239011 [Caerostris extrusa]|uniref:Uncharacterized protein n=1 Tax=Caerostris extrusa TaxID=172846 RepID=A0AAV4R647_CAEEX|nr:hypothetical protein CEXT_239011 [Caerostris extrusa]